jgi:putative septation protein spoVG
LFDNIIFHIDKKINTFCKNNKRGGVIMQITEVRVKRFSNSNSRMKAVAQVVFDDVFVVHDIKIIQTDDKVFVAMPNKKVSDGSYKDIAHPISSEFRSNLEKAVLDAYEKQPETETEDNA